MSKNLVLFQEFFQERKAPSASTIRRIGAPPDKKNKSKKYYRGAINVGITFPLTCTLTSFPRQNLIQTPTLELLGKHIQIPTVPQQL